MIDQTVKAHFEIHEVVVLTGFTKYMLDYLAREDILAPSDRVQARRGLRRRYAYEDVVLLRALHAICIGKGKIRHLKEALLTFRREFGPLRPGQKLDGHLFVQGDELCVYTGAQSGRQLLTGQMTLSFVVDLAAISQHVADCIVVKRGSREFKLTKEVAHRAEAERRKIWAPIKARREAA